MASHGNFREPVEYVINQYWRKKFLKINYDDEEFQDLPEYPFRMIRNAENKCEKIIYDESGDMEWSEELIRDWRGKLIRIKITLPKINNEDDYFYIDLIRDDTGKFIGCEVND